MVIFSIRFTHQVFSFIQQYEASMTSQENLLIYLLPYMIENQKF